MYTVNFSCKIAITKIFRSTTYKNARCIHRCTFWNEVIPEFTEEDDDEDGEDEFENVDTSTCK